VNSELDRKNVERSGCSRIKGAVLAVAWGIRENHEEPQSGYLVSDRDSNRTSPHQVLPLEPLAYRVRRNDTSAVALVISIIPARFIWLFNVVTGLDSAIIQVGFTALGAPIISNRKFEL
jgi:hypothetical protein